MDGGKPENFLILCLPWRRNSRGIFPLMARLGIVIAADLCNRYLLSLFAVRSVLYAERSPVNTPHVSCSSHVSIWEKEKDANKMEGETIACQIVIGARKKVGREVGGKVGGGVGGHDSATALNLGVTGAERESKP